MPSFLTVKEAARFTGKSPSSIRRVIYPILHDDAHPDRVQIQPSVEEALQLRMKGENFAWRLSEELLRREITVEPVADKGQESSSSRPSAAAEGELLAMLRRELDIKNQQITQHAELMAKQMELIKGLGERLREGNILIASLQQRLALSDGRERPPSDGPKPKRTGSLTTEKTSQAGTKAAKPKKGFFSRLFA